MSISNASAPVGVCVVLEVVIVAGSSHPIAAEASAGNCQVPVPVHDDRVFEIEGWETSEAEIEDGTAGLQLLSGVRGFVLNGDEVVGNVLDWVIFDVTLGRDDRVVGDVLERVTDVGV